MQPRTLVWIIIILPLLVSNAVYLLSAYEGFIPWCIPYIDGCTTMSKAARSGDSIFVFRAVMIGYSVLLILFWIYAKQWLDLLYGRSTNFARIILWLGVIGAIFLMVYIDFLGTSGEVNRFMRKYGIMVFFVFTPLAQTLMLRQHYHVLPSLKQGTINPKILHYQLAIVVIMLIIGIISTVLDLTNNKTYESENIIEWNFSFILNIYFFGMVFLWKKYSYHLKNDSD